MAMVSGRRAVRAHVSAYSFADYRRLRTLYVSPTPTDVYFERQNSN
jgi:hypothetical protein